MVVLAALLAEGGAKTLFAVLYLIEELGKIGSVCDELSFVRLVLLLKLVELCGLFSWVSGTVRRYHQLRGLMLKVFETVGDLGFCIVPERHLFLVGERVVVAEEFVLFLAQDCHALLLCGIDASLQVLIFLSPLSSLHRALAGTKLVGIPVFDVFSFGERIFYDEVTFEVGSGAVS